MPEEIEEDKFGKIGESIHKIGIAKIILLLLIAAAVFWYVNLPKNGSVSILITELDSDKRVSGAIVSIEDSNGQILQSTGTDSYQSLTDDTGRVSFANVPANRALTISIDTSAATGNYEPTSDLDIQLESEENLDQIVRLEKRTKLSLSPELISSQVTPTCVKQQSITVKNDGDDLEEVELVGSGGLQNAFTFTPVTVAPGSSENTTLTIDMTKANASSTVNGKIRIKGTNKGVTVRFTTIPAFQVVVSPSSLNCAAGKNVCPSIVTIQNNGKSSLTNLKVEPSESIVGAIDGGEIEKYYTADDVPPDAEAKFGVKLVSTTQAIGVITIKGDCFSKQVNVQTGQ